LQEATKSLAWWTLAHLPFDCGKTPNIVGMCSFAGIAIIVQTLSRLLPVLSGTFFEIADQEYDRWKEVMPLVPMAMTQANNLIQQCCLTTLAPMVY